VHMLERRGVYLALVHDQYLVDLVTEEDIAEGRLRDYEALYSADPCISGVAAKGIDQWVRQGGTFVATCDAGSRNEFGEPTTVMRKLFGLREVSRVERQPGEYRTRGKLNDIPALDTIRMAWNEFPVIGLKCVTIPEKAKVVGTFASDGTPSLLENKYGRGKAVWFATTPGISYIKEAKFVANALAERWPEKYRTLLTDYAADAGALPLAKLSKPVVEAGVYDAPGGTALVLANFTYEPDEALTVEIPVASEVSRVTSLVHGDLRFESEPVNKTQRRAGYSRLVKFQLPLGIDDLVLLKRN